jgi:hypothetical protein
MEQIILTDIPFEPDVFELMDKLRVKKGSSYVGKLESLVHEAQAIARPKALYKIVPIAAKEDDHVVIDGVTLTSRVLRVNLEQANRVFLFVATGGVELEQWTQSINDILFNFWADAITERALRAAIEALLAHIVEHYRPGHLSAMHPGSLADWPIKQQHVLFRLLGDTQASIGVELLDSMLMSPTKSASGIYFPTDETFQSCQLCPIENCPNRRAPYDESLYERKYCPAPN